MNRYNPNIHRRRSIRLKGYDYSREGLYFITICCQDRECLFGEITRHEMVLNDAGRMVEKWYYELQNKFPDIKCREMTVMPNHFHCVVENTGPVGADLRVCPNNPHVHPNNPHVHPNNPHVCPNKNDPNDIEQPGLGGQSPLLGEPPPLLGEHVGSPLHRVVQWFKTMSTNEYIRGVKTLGWKRFNGKLWQRNYYEHIIRNEPSYQRIAEYIINNPIKWQGDKFYRK